MKQEVQVPQIGESVSSGVLAVWLKQAGDAVQEGDELFELETDKATLSVPSPAAGVLSPQVAEGAEVTVGQVVALIDSDAAAAAAAAAADEAPAGAAADGLSPAVRRIVAEHGLDAAAIHGSGPGWRITKGGDVNLNNARFRGHVVMNTGQINALDVVDTLQLKGQAVTFSDGAYTAAWTSENDSEVFVTVQSVWIPATGNAIRLIQAAGQVEYWIAGGSSTSAGGFEVRLLYAGALIGGPWRFDTGPDLNNVTGQNDRRGGFSIALSHETASSGTYALQVRGVKTAGGGTMRTKTELRGLWVTELKR